jgi:nicotinamide mononucleotide transporter
MSTIEAVGAVFGFLCVVLYIRQNIWSWPVGLVQIALFIVVFYDARLYSDLVLHVIYLLMQVFGWYHWHKGGEQGAPLKVTRLTRTEIWLWAGSSIIGSLLAGYLMATRTDAAAPLPDAFVAVTSVVAQWLLTRKKLESWVFWFVIDLVAMGIYFYKALYFATALYALYLVLAVTGYLTWRKSCSSRTGEDEINDSRPDTGKIRSALSGSSKVD